MSNGSASLSRLVVSSLAVAVAILFGAVAASTGMIHFSAPALPTVTAVEAAVETPEEPRIVRVEPIDLTCQARVHAVVPIEARKTSTAFGRVYRTDRVTMTAYGDLDTCGEGAGTRIDTAADGTATVTIDAGAVRFVRPRVDTVRTAASVEVDRSAIGRVLDAFPWSDGSEGLTPLAYAHAQTVIGSSQCTAAAYEATEQRLREAYRTQATEQGFSPDAVTVTITGQPTFPPSEPVELGDDIKTTVDTNGIRCYAPTTVSPVH